MRLVTPDNDGRSGSGRRGARHRAGNSSRTGGKRLKFAGSAIEIISDGDLRRLARRGGVKRVGKGTWVEARLALVDFLGKAVRRAVILAEHCRRYTVTGNDMVYALKQMGRPIYMPGCDWTYGAIYTKERVSKAVRRPVTPGQLLEAALRRASLASLSGSAAAAEPGLGAEAAAMEVAATPAAGARHLWEQEVEDNDQAEAAALQARAAAGVAGEAFGSQLSVQLSASDLDEQENVREDEKVAAAGQEAAEELLAEPQQAPALAAACRASAPSPPTTAALPPFAVPTPGARGPLSVEHAERIQAALSDLLHGQLCQHGVASRQLVYEELPKALPCTPAEIADVLYVLEQREAIMTSEDSIYLCI